MGQLLKAEEKLTSRIYEINFSVDFNHGLRFMWHNTMEFQTTQLR